MNNKLDIQKQTEFIKKLRNNSLSVPNEFTRGMGLLIKKARIDQGITQSEFANKLNRRQGTISDMENGKSEIGVLTLLQVCIELRKPISYFFPESLLRDFIVDVKTANQYKFLDIAKKIENFGDTELSLDILERLAKYFEDCYETPEIQENENDIINASN